MPLADYLQINPVDVPSMAMVGAWWLLMRSLRYSGYGIALLTIVSTWLHEMMHLIYGFLLRAKPVSFSLWPKQVDGRWVLGSVGFTNLNIWNSAFVAFAPLTLAILGVYLFQWWLVPAYQSNSCLEWLGASYVVACCFFSCIPSSTDIRIGAVSVLMYSILGYGLWYTFE